MSRCQPSKLKPFDLTSEPTSALITRRQRKLHGICPELTWPRGRGVRGFFRYEPSSPRTGPKEPNDDRCTISVAKFDLCQKLNRSAPKVCVAAAL
jgi:hypothetical protein